MPLTDGAATCGALAYGIYPPHNVLVARPTVIMQTRRRMAAVNWRSKNLPTRSALLPSIGLALTGIVV